MATILAAGNGDFNAGSTWVGGIVPGPGDEARSNSFLIDITSNVTCSRLDNTGGGRFRWLNSSTVTAEVIGKIASVGCLHIEPVLSNQNFRLLGDALAPTVTSALSVGASGSGDSSWTFNFKGIATGGGGAGRHAIGIQKAGTVIIESGSVLLNTTRADAVPLNLANFGGGVATIEAGVIVEADTGAAIIFASGAGELNIYGILKSATSAAVRSLAVNGITRFYGTLGTSPLNVTFIDCAVGAELVWGKTSIEVNAIGAFPFNAGRVTIDPAVSLGYIEMFKGGVVKKYYSADLVPTSPATKDVRDQVIYGMNNELVGTLKIAPPASVALGVQTDDTVGSALITPESLVPVIREAIWNALTSEFSEENSFGNIIREIYLMYGLVKGSPLRVTDNSRIVGDIEQTLEDDGETTTVTRL